VEVHVEVELELVMVMVMMVVVVMMVMLMVMVARRRRRWVGASTALPEGMPVVASLHNTQLCPAQEPVLARVRVWV